MKSTDTTSSILLTLVDYRNWFDLGLSNVILDKRVAISISEQSENMGIEEIARIEGMNENLMQQWPLPKFTYFQMVISINSDDVVGSWSYRINFETMIKLRKVLMKREKMLWRRYYG